MILETWVLKGIVDSRYRVTASQLVTAFFAMGVNPLSGKKKIYSWRSGGAADVSGGKSTGWSWPPAGTPL
jgi:hypothetical protein